MSDDVKKSLSEEEVNMVLQFAYGLGNGFQYGFSTPYTQNQNFINLTNISSSKPNVDSILSSLENAKTNFKELQGYSEFLDIFDTIFGKTIDYLDGMLSYDLSISCKNMKDPQGYNSKEYKDDLKRVYKFLDSFDYVQEFRKITRQLLIYGVSFNWFRDSNGTYNEDTDALELEKRRNFALQFLPQNRCMLTGYFEKGLLFDFDMSYFLNSTVDIDLFDPWFKKTYAHIWKDKQNYNPDSQFMQRDGTFSTYTQTSPTYGAYCFKWNPSTFVILPPFASLMKSAINNDVVTNLQLDKDIISAYLLLAGEIGVMDSLKSGDKPNQTKFSPNALGQFMSLVTSGLKRNVKAVAMPLENIRGWQYNDQNPNMANTQYNSTASQGASASRMIYSSDKMSQSELQNAILTDYNLMKKLYVQYENFLDFYINRKTKKYKFSFHFNGSNYIFEQESRQKAINELATVGLTLNSSAWASAYGIKPQDFDRMLEEAHYGDLTNKLTLLLNKNTMNNDGSSSDNSSGRPTSNDNQLNDKGEESRDRE